MRKLTVGNKLNFTIFTIIIIVIIFLLVFGLQYVLKIDKQIYTLEASTFLFDSENIPIELENTATMRAEWDNNYHLETTDGKKYNVGAQPITYNKNTGKVTLYGQRYKVSSDASVETISEATEFSNFSEDSFYKLADRKYLILSDSIKNDTQTISTKRYLIVILDKAGNTMLLNNEINAKTINSMKLETPTFTFDVANEKLIFENDVTVDLTKIIGSTNQYKEQVKIADKKKNNIGGEGTNADSSQVTTDNENAENEEGTESNGASTIINNTTTNYQNNDSQTIINQGPTNGENNSGGNNNNNNGNNNNDQDGVNNTPLEKNISLRGVTTTSSSITVLYNIIDPENKYQTVYVNLEGNINKTIALDKSETSYVITDLTPNTNYKITMGAREINSDGTISENIEDTLAVKTNKVNTGLSIVKVSLSKIYFNLALDPNYLFDSANILLYVDGKEIERKKVDIASSATTSGWTSSFNYEYGKQIMIRVENATYNGKAVDIDIQAKMGNY